MIYPTQEQIDQFNRVFWREFNTNLGDTIMGLRDRVRATCLAEYGWTIAQFIYFKDAAIKQAERNTSE